MRYCTPESVFGLPAAKLGVGYGFEGIRRLLEITSPSYAREICFTGKRYSAEEALHMQLVNRIVAESEIEQFVDETATTIAENAPLTVGSLKQIFIELAKNPPSVILSDVNPTSNNVLAVRTISRAARRSWKT